MSQINILLIFAIYIGSTFGSLQIDIRHLGVIAHRFPKHIALIVAEVYAMHMTAGILALHLRSCA